MKALSSTKKLRMIKLLHTLIWCVFVSAILFVYYAGAFNKVSTLVWCCIGAVVFEGIVLMINKWKCPLTSLASNYTSYRPVGFDIFLPKWLAKHNKTIFTSLFFIGLCLVIWCVV